MSYRPSQQQTRLRHRLRRPTAIAALAFIALLTAASAGAHSFGVTLVTLVLRTDGNFQASMQLDLDALALGVAPDSDDAELVAALAGMSDAEITERTDALRQLLQRRVRILFDGERTDVRIQFPDRAAGLTRNATPPTFLGIRAWLAGSVPSGAQQVSFRASRAFLPVQLTVVDERTGTTVREPLARGDESTPFPLDPELQPDAPEGQVATLLGYVRLGFLHIIPAGVDHMLFVLGLFLLSTRLGPLLLQVSAFTVAHTVTLALSALGFVQLTPAIVEPLIALSIAYVGVENAITDELRSWRPLLVFVFGLLHGLGFAGVLGDIGLPAGRAMVALIGFNVGVELGQLAVIGAAILIFRRFQQRSWYRQRVAVPASLAIAAVGLFWFVTRALTG